MHLKINFFYFLIFFTSLNNSQSQNLKYFDKVYNLFRDDSNNILIVKNIFNRNEKDENIIVINNEYYDVIEKSYSYDLNFSEKKLYNTLYYVEFDDLSNNQISSLPLVFAESFNKNWEILNINNSLENISHFSHFINYFKLKTNLDSNYRFLDYSHYVANNYSNLFLINFDENISNYFLIYYKKSFTVQLFWILLILTSLIIIFSALLFFKKKSIK